MESEESSPDVAGGQRYGEVAACERDDEHAQARASKELYEHLASALAHELNNALQAVLGPLWELEELTTAMPAARPHLLRMQEACKRGMALVRLQTESFATPGQGQASVAALIEEARPLLRHLLGVLQVLRVTIAPGAMALTANPRLFRRLLLLLCKSLGQRVRGAGEIELALAPAATSLHSPPMSASAASRPDSGQVCLRITARPRGGAVAHAENPAPAISLSAFSPTERWLAERLGVTLRAHTEDSLLTYEVQFPPAGTFVDPAIPA